jgi:hypothetical protein
VFSDYYADNVRVNCLAFELPKDKTTGKTKITVTLSGYNPWPTTTAKEKTITIP